MGSVGGNAGEEGRDGGDADEGAEEGGVDAGKTVGGGAGVSDGEVAWV